MTSTIFDKLIYEFNNIHLLTLSSRQDRERAVIDQLREIGMSNNDEKESLKIHYATPFPHNDIIIEAFNKSGKGRFTKPNEYDCSRNHYAIVKEAYDHGYHSVLIIEDDIQFLKDASVWENIIDSIPEDWDILQFGGFTADPRITKYLQGEELWFTHKDVGVWNCSMYALSRKGMEFYLAFMDKIFWVADGPLYKAPLNDKLINTYLCKIPMVIQADKDVVASDIRSEETDSIDYKTQNLYEQNIDKSQYYEYKL